MTKVADGNRQAATLLPGIGHTEAALAQVAWLASQADETPEGRSIVVLAKEKYNIRDREMAPLNAKFIPFSAYTRMSGIDVVLPDARGHGESDWLPGGAYRLDQFVGDAHALAAQAAPLPVWVGASMGGLLTHVRITARSLRKFFAAQKDAQQ